jgi:hypothetical protein
MGASCSEGIITNLKILWINNRSHVLGMHTQFVDTIDTPTSKQTAYMSNTVKPYMNSLES